MGRHQRSRPGDDHERRADARALDWLEREHRVADEDVDRLRALGAEPVVTTRPHEAVAGAVAVHTDVWASMGQESEARARAFEGFQVDDRVMAAAAPDAVFMHCLPAHRGEEVTASVVDGPQSVVIAQAHNRLHSVRGLLAWLLDRDAQMNGDDA